MDRDSNDLNAGTGTNRDSSTGGNPGGTRNTGGAGSYGAGAGTSNTGGTANLGGTSGLGGSANTGSGTAGYGTGGAGQTNYGSTGATQSAAGAGLGLGGASEQESRTDHLKHAAHDRADQAREKLGDAGTKARDFKTKVEQGLADRLEAGANRLRERGAGGTTSGSGGNAGTMTPAYAGGGADASAASTSDRVSGAQANVAKGMDATADWLRNGDLKGTIESQARSNPGRTLLVALGVGYLLGKTIRR